MPAKFERDAQLTLSGASMSEAEWAASLATVQDVVTRCPFCLKSQGLREMCFANIDGSLCSKRRCKWCKKKMLKESAVVFLRGEEAYAQFVATYPMWWMNVDHTEFMAALEQLKQQGVFQPWVFWTEYRKIKPKKGEEGAANANEVRELTRPIVHAPPSAPPPPPTDRKMFAFKDKTGSLPPCYCYGERIEADEKWWRVVTGSTAQRLRKDRWEPIDTGQDEKLP